MTYEDSPEKWKPLRNFEGYYEISNHGHLRRCAHTIVGRGGMICFYPQRRMSLSLRKGYAEARLSKNNKKTTIRLHQEVAAAFIGPCPEGYEVGHKNDIRDDNHWTNLEYLTHAKNVSDRNLRERQSRGESHAKAKLKSTEVIIIREKLSAGYTMAELGRQYNVTAQSIDAIKRRVSWRHV